MSAMYQTNNYYGYGYGQPRGSDYYQPANLIAPPVQAQQIAGSNISYQYSLCTGRRKALLIGINYIGTNNQLRGCINDIHNILNFLTTRCNYRQEDIVLLSDDQPNPVCQPTRANMIRAMHWLVKDAQPNDALFFHYSGHGGQVEDLDGDEEDGYDSTIYPVDFATAGVIIDDELHDILVKPLQQGVRLTALMDSCHSGTALDLPYIYSTKGVVKEPNMMKDVGGDAMGAALCYMSGNTYGMMSSLGNMVTKVSRGKGMGKQKREQMRQAKFCSADVIMFSGSKDNQTSADSVENGQATGAMSYAFIKVLSAQPQQTYLSLLQNMRQELTGKYSQKPQLSASHPIDVNLQFVN
ncbi:hypothetical protein Kpol_1072p54 [Vanderwaltozyma polyspora DSM 70294]|uniref:Metacaspase-1 n=1 Tax=Vanderwaltozyma polyspora (strain ATCC 22028 / DSM 70294 / BCRC 21397 / CBS 2163 / NBRC 10782 / NRRL Y-8283 / UCD 57-17) TaxID=436907 RepID=A7TKS2_VANPO|nr:uncharacterized protein Kpol_1072p54 [Vanderwaltozyma polyspora DSM 70294]EDO17184.1 hypothetical protein Kpol_1072p54 [Vanderwaltozyma polyspora DSM 70294]